MDVYYLTGASLGEKLVRRIKQESGILSRELHPPFPIYHFL